jgi:uncharacterized protein YjiS (DUF1127 family)
MSTHVSRATVPASTNELWPYAEASRGTAVRLVWQGIAAAFAQAIAAAQKYRKLRRAERELQYLDERMLKDIGITRSEIGSMTRFGRGGGAVSLGWLQ